MANLYSDLFGLGFPQDGTVIELAEHGRAGGVSSGQPFKFVRSVNESVYIDEVDSATTYIGKAKPGEATSSTSWQITKILISGTVTSITHADGNDNFDNIWDNRASLSYS